MILLHLRHLSLLMPNEHLPHMMEGIGLLVIILSHDFRLSNKIIQKTKQQSNKLQKNKLQKTKKGKDTMHLPLIWTLQKLQMSPFATLGSAGTLALHF